MCFHYFFFIFTMNSCCSFMHIIIYFFEFHFINHSSDSFCPIITSCEQKSIWKWMRTHFNHFTLIWVSTTELSFSIARIYIEFIPLILLFVTFSLHKNTYFSDAYWNGSANSIVMCFCCTKSLLPLLFRERAQKKLAVFFKVVLSHFCRVLEHKNSIENCNCIRNSSHTASEVNNALLKVPLFFFDHFYYYFAKRDVDLA